MTGPQPDVAKTFVELADTLVADFDLVDFMHLVTVRTQQDLGVESVELLLADNHAGLNVIAASGEQARVLELFSCKMPRVRAGTATGLDDPSAVRICRPKLIGGRALSQRPSTAAS